MNMIKSKRRMKQWEEVGEKQWGLAKSKIGNERGASPTTINKNKWINKRGKRGGPWSGTWEGGSDWSGGDEADSIALPSAKDVDPHLISVAGGPQDGASRQPQSAVGTHPLAAIPVDPERAVLLLAAAPRCGAQYGLDKCLNLNRLIRG